MSRNTPKQLKQLKHLKKFLDEAMSKTKKESK